MTAFPEPRGGPAEPAALLARYLDFYRETVIAKATSLPRAELRTSRLPSGWTPLELLVHLHHMERRWVVWGFLGEAVEEPWGDERDGRWHAPADLTLEEAAARLREVGARTSAVLADLGLDEQGPPGPRYGEEEPATLGWTCFHVLQEYARHAGHLDVAVELAGGPTGE